MVAGGEWCAPAIFYDRGGRLVWQEGHERHCRSIPDKIVCQVRRHTSSGCSRRPSGPFPPRRALRANFCLMRVEGSFEAEGLFRIMTGPTRSPSRRAPAWRSDWRCLASPCRRRRGSALRPTSTMWPHGRPGGRSATLCLSASRMPGNNRAREFARIRAPSESERVSSVASVAANPALALRARILRIRADSRDDERAARFECGLQ